MPVTPCFDDCSFVSKVLKPESLSPPALFFFSKIVCVRVLEIPYEFLGWVLLFSAKKVSEILIRDYIESVACLKVVLTS